MPRSTYAHDIVASNGEYTDPRTGERKKRYITIGKGFTDDQGRISAKLDSIPVGPDWSGWISLYPPRDRETSGQRQRDAPTPAQPRRAASPPPRAAADWDNEADEDTDAPAVADYRCSAWQVTSAGLDAFAVMESRLETLIAKARPGEVVGSLRAGEK